MGMHLRPEGPEESAALWRWVAEAERDAEYTRLAIDALAGNQVAQAELRYRFPWADQGPAERWEDIPSKQVRELVQLALVPNVSLETIDKLRHVAYLRHTLNAACQWTQDQTTLLQQLVEVA